MIPGINTPFQYGSDALGASVDELKLVTSFLLSYPLAGLLKRIPDRNPWQKNLFILTVSIFYLIGLFDLWAGVATLLIDASTVYFLASYFKGPYMPWLGFTFLMGHMSINHIQRQLAGDPSVIDITGAQMVWVMKLSSFCWHVHDGRLAEKDLADWQKEKQIKELPGFLNYAAYVLFFPSFMAGPAFDYVDYEQWIETTMFNLPPGVDPSKAPPTRKKRKIPRSGTPAMKRLAIGLAWTLGFLQCSSWYYPDLILHADYASKYGFLHRMWHLYILGVVQRMKYYGVWTLTEGACVLAGIGYKGFDIKTGKADWSRLQNINPRGVELAQNTHAYLGYWNMNTNHWLRHCVYLRVTPKGRKPGFRATLATFVTSAFWHGFYPGYYLSFILASFLQTVAKNGRRYVRPFFMAPDGIKPTPNKKYYDVATWVITQSVFAFTVAPFFLLTLPACMKAWGQVYFYGVLCAAGAIAFFASPGKAMLAKQLKKRNHNKVAQAVSAEVDRSIGLGIPDDPEREFDEFVTEVRAEIEARRKSGQQEPLNVKAIIEEKLGHIIGDGARKQ